MAHWRRTPIWRVASFCGTGGDGDAGGVVTDRTGRWVAMHWTAMKWARGCGVRAASEGCNGRKWHRGAAEDDSTVQWR